MIRSAKRRLVVAALVASTFELACRDAGNGEARRAIGPALDREVERLIGNRGVDVDAAVVRRSREAPGVVIGIAERGGIRHRANAVDRPRRCASARYTAIALSPAEGATTVRK